MDERGERLFLFVGRNIGRHKQHLPQRVAAGGRLGQCLGSTMDGVKAAAEKADIHPGFPRSVPCSLPCSLPCDAPLVSSFAGLYGKSCCQNMFAGVDLYERVLQKTASQD